MMDTQNCSEKTDEELVGLILEEEEYLICLIQRYEEKLLRYIIRISGLNRHEAEDVLQEVFIKVYRNLNDFDKDLKFSSWIYRITHNQVISNYRKIKSRPESIALDIDSDILENLASELNTEREVDKKLLQEKIKLVLKKLDIKYKEILILKFFEGKSYREISDILKKSMGTVATLINRAKNQFREEYKKQNIKI